MAKKKTLSEAEKIVEAIAPDNYRPLSMEALTTKIRTGSATFYDVLMYNVNLQGLDVSKGVVEFNKNNQKFLDIVAEYGKDRDGMSLKNFIKYYNALNSKNLLDENYWETTKDLDSFRNRILPKGRTKVENHVSTTLISLDTLVFGLAPASVKGEYREQLKGSDKSGLKKWQFLAQDRKVKKFTRLPDKPVDAIGPIIKGISQISNPDMKSALLLQLLHPGRNISHYEITMSKEVSESRVNKAGESTAIRPYIAEEIIDGVKKYTLNVPLDASEAKAAGGSGRKYTYERVVPGDILQIILGEQYKNAQKENRKFLFKNNINSTSVYTAVKDHITPQLKPLESVMGREFTGGSDIRKMAIISMITGTNNKMATHLLSGHELTQALARELSSDILATNYFTPFGLDPYKTDATMKLHEHYIASLLGFDNLLDIIGPEGANIDSGKLSIDAQIDVVKPGDRAALETINKPTVIKNSQLNSAQKEDKSKRIETKNEEANKTAELMSEEKKTKIAKVRKEGAEAKRETKQAEKDTLILDGEIDDIKNEKQNVIDKESQEYGDKVSNEMDEYYKNKPGWKKNEKGNWVKDTSNIGHNRGPKLSVAAPVAGLVGYGLLTAPSETVASEVASTATYTGVRTTGASLARTLGGIGLQKTGIATLSAVNPVAGLGAIAAGEAFFPTEAADTEMPSEIQRLYDLGSTPEEAYALRDYGTMEEQMEAKNLQDEKTREARTEAIQMGELF